MTGSSRPKRRDGLSRRDFVQGKFWRAFGFGRPKSTSQHGPPKGKTSREKPPVGALVMRYPKTLEEVAAADPMMAGAVKATPDKVDGGTADADKTDATSMQARRGAIPVLRPPGAIEEASFLDRCTRCGDCITACPHDAIVLAPAQMRDAAGTPMLQPDHQPCMMCEGLPCIDACGDGVLSRMIPLMMGTAKITEHLCIAYHGTTCTVCSERCPVPNAITVESGKSVVNEATCTGCGVCRYVCPAPENAILLMPAFLRPLPPPSRDP